MSTHLVPSQDQVGQTNLSPLTKKSLSLPPMELKPLPSHLKYAYLDSQRQLPVIIANNLHQQQQDKLLEVLRQHKKAIDVVKKEVTKLLAVGIIYPISNSQWVSPVQVVPKKFGMAVIKNQQDELEPMRIQKSWQVYIDYRKLNQATRKDHFPLPFIDQVLEKLAGKSHYCFLDGFSGYMKIHIAPED
ncbi:Retrovirus-related Pol polyprotein, partial [Mucuna pruriens]